MNCKNNTKCRWVIEKNSGDMVMKCCDDVERARVPTEILVTPSDLPPDQKLIVRHLLKKIEEELNCKTG